MKTSVMMRICCTITLVLLWHAPTHAADVSRENAATQRDDAQRSQESQEQLQEQQSITEKKAKDTTVPPPRFISTGAVLEMQAQSSTDVIQTSPKRLPDLRVAPIKTEEDYKKAAAEWKKLKDQSTYWQILACRGQEIQCLETLLADCPADESLPYNPSIALGLVAECTKAAHPACEKHSPTLCKSYYDTGVDLGYAVLPSYYGSCPERTTGLLFAAQCDASKTVIEQECMNTQDATLPVQTGTDPDQMICVDNQVMKISASKIFAKDGNHIDPFYGNYEGTYYNGACCIEPQSDGTCAKVVTPDKSKYIGCFGIEGADSKLQARAKASNDVMEDPCTVELKVVSECPQFGTEPPQIILGP